MQVITHIDEWRTLRAAWPANEGIGLVPTMGYLHNGHLALVTAAHAACTHVVASIFVNPMQFGPQEDLAAYPRDLPRDLALLEAAGVAAVFAPPVEVMYPPGFATAVTLTGPLIERLEGARRPGHFAGVATIVTKLLAIIQPTHAYFGQKDAQQTAVVRRFVADLNLPVTIVVAPIIREADGLAMSSRNVYLQPPERQAALVLHQALEAGRAAITSGSTDADTVRAVMRATITAEPLATLEYADVVATDTFSPLMTMQPPALLTIVARVGKPRLLDNYLWRADGSWDVGKVVDSD